MCTSIPRVDVQWDGYTVQYGTVLAPSDHLRKASSHPPSHLNISLLFVYIAVVSVDRSQGLQLLRCFWGHGHAIGADIMRGLDLTHADGFPKMCTIGVSQIAGPSLG